MTESHRHSTLDFGTTHFQEANAMLREALEESDVIELNSVFAQRYLGCGMQSGKKLQINGTPGNDMACYMNGGEIEVHGNAQDQIGNTMNDGTIVIHGRCGDAAGYGMRGGQIFIRDDCGWRVGIHMKEYQDKKPVIVIGGDAGSFLGEYMAGGIIVLLGKPGRYLASGMHGGVIYLREAPEDWEIDQTLVLQPIDDSDREVLGELLGAYNGFFSDELDETPQLEDGWQKLSPISSRPYESMYAN